MNSLSRITSYLASKIMVPHVLRKRKLRNQLVTVLCLHRVSDEPSVCWPPLRLKVFDQLCQYWSENYTVINFSTLNNHVNANRPLLILSFDDGYADFYNHAWSILKKYGLKANINIVTDCASSGSAIWTQRLNNAFDSLWNKGIDKTIYLKNGTIIQSNISKKQFVKENEKIFHYLCKIEKEQRQKIIDGIIEDFSISEFQTPLMNWDQIVKLSEEGLEIGSHTATHNVLPTIRYSSEIYHEIVNSKKTIEEKIGKKINVLSYPNGYATEEANRLAFESGYEFLLMVGNDLFPLKDLRQKNIVPRILIYHDRYYENLLNTENFFKTVKSYVKANG